MKTFFSAAIAVTLFTVGCGGGTTTTDGGTTDGGATEVKLDTPARIDAFLEGKTLTMSGANIPSHPNGFNENQNFAASSQCYKDTVIKVAGSNYTVTANLGTIRALDGGVPAAFEIGVCDHTTGGVFGPTTSTIVSYSNVKGNAECFDVDVTYNAYGQEGRATIVDGGVVKMELFFKSSFVNNRCADGNVGSGVKKANKLADGGVGEPTAFVGNAVQTYVISQ